jgi:hypothetical protein
VSAPWVHTPAQLLADLREACQRYRMRAYGQALEIDALKARVTELQDGIGAAMISLETNVDEDVVWFSQVETLWEHLGAVRDPDGDLGPPVATINPWDEHAYNNLPRDPVTGRPVIA